MSLRVLKFGGTSVGTPEARKVALKRVEEAISEAGQVVVVVSAIGRSGMPYATDTLIDAVREVSEATDPDPRDLDLLMACGEILSGVIFAQLLRSQGIPASTLTGAQAGIVTDDVHGDARVVKIEAERVLRTLEDGRVPVVCGFQGAAAESGEVTTLGRGGSDLTATALGVALGAERVDIFTDVDGVMTADPRLVPSARLLEQAEYGEVAELAHLGAKVVHPRAAELAMQHRISLHVRNTFKPGQGTEIVLDAGVAHTSVTGVTASERLAFVQFDGVATSHQAKVLALLSKSGASIRVLTLGREALSFAVPMGQLPSIRDNLDGLVMEDPRIILSLGHTQRASLQARALGGGEIVRGRLVPQCAVVSVTGREGHQRPGVFLEVISLLVESGIEPIQTSDSEYSVGVLLGAPDVERAVQILHKSFIEEP